MRNKFVSDLYDLMKNDEKIVLITADMGYKIFDSIREEMSDQFFNVGAAEQVMMDMAVGFSLGGRIPVVYSITPFLLFRGMETIRNYFDHENIPVVMVGSGRGKDYEKEGFSHDATDDYILKLFRNIVFIKPEKDFNLKEIIYLKKPVYLNLKR